MEVPLTLGPPSIAIGAVLLTLMPTVAEPLTLVTCVVAVMVAWVATGTAGAVNWPDADITPIVLVQLTALVTLPLAVAVHRLFCSD